jgi:hypothetical protein
MMGTVKLPPDVDEAIQEFRRCEETTADIIIAIFNGADSKAAFTLRKFSEDAGRFEDLLKALVNGYEVEQSPEDKVRELYGRYKNCDHQEKAKAEYCRGVCNGIIDTLNALNIKVEGVNT